MSITSPRHIVRKLVRGVVIRMYRLPIFRATARRVKWLVPVSVRLRLFRLANPSSLASAASARAIGPEVPHGARWILLALERKSAQLEERDAIENANST
jgi:hypothetical protein